MPDAIIANKRLDFLSGVVLAVLVIFCCGTIWVLLSLLVFEVELLEFEVLFDEEVDDPDPLEADDPLEVVLQELL